MSKPTPRKRGRQALADRARVMRRDKGLCQDCLARGVLTLATEVDHIVPLFKGGDDSDDNKAAICADCHQLKTRSDKGQAPSGGCDARGFPTDPRHPWNRAMKT